MDKINELKNKISDFQAKSAAKEEIKAFIPLVLTILKNSKESFDKISAENLQIIKDGIAYIEDSNQKQAKLLDDKTNTATGQFDASIATIKALLTKIENIKAIPGKDGKDGLDGIGIDGKDGKDGKDGSPDTRVQIVEKINTGEQQDQKIKLSQIEGIEGLSTNEDLNRAINIVDQRTSYLVQSVPKKITGHGTHNLTVSTTAPDNPEYGDLWFDIS